MWQINSIDWPWYVWLLPFLFATLFLLFFRNRFTRSKSMLIYDDMDEGFDSSSQVDVILEEKAKRAIKSRIRIIQHHHLKSRETPKEEFEQLVADPLCKALNMDQLWSDSTISTIFLGPDFQRELTDFFAAYRQRMGLTSPQIAVEIGGFLLGRYARDDKNKKYQVLIESFVPISSENEHSLHLEFNTRSLSSELGDAQDLYPDLVVVGWFHTHPGHGLFLSKPDLAIQRGFFDEDFQFAMEIDSLSDDYDLGFFTHKKNGDINNMAPKNEWFSWYQIEDSQQ